MRLRSHEPLIRRSLKQLTPGCPRPAPSSHVAPRDKQQQHHHQQQQRRRPFSSTPSSQDEARDVAVLGGGITGLASAYYLSRADPNAKITVYEASSRLGGWMQSTHVDVEGGRVLFESGPRTLRPSDNGLVTAKLMEDLELKDDIIFVPMSSPAAQYRYIYYPDRLNRLPAPRDGLLSGVLNLWTNRKLFEGFFQGAWNDIRTEATSKHTDESIGAFISRRLNSSLANNITSALYHGIYAGDIYKLSVRSLVPFLPYLEEKYGSVFAGYAQLAGKRRKLMQRRLWDISQDEEMEKISPQMAKSMRKCSVFTLLGGLSQLTNRLEEVLEGNDNITLMRNTPIAKLQKPEDGSAKDLSITLFGAKDQKLGTHNTVISTLSHNALSSLVNLPDSIKSYHQPNVSVMLVNLYFSNPAILAANPGFGYLIPRSVPYAQNPECALGVVFDSYAAPGQDTASGSKVTVMLGGHWWDSFETLPGKEEGLWMARSILARHLNITAEPDAYQVSVQRDCIPQYVVGHQQHMGEFHDYLLRKFGGRLKVAGASYGGVGVNDCVRSAYDMGKAVKERGWTSATTGLERYSRDKLDVVELEQVDDGFAIVDPET